MARFEEAVKRLFGNVFVCKKCKTKRRADPSRILKNQIACRRCGCKHLRAIKSKK